MGIAIGLAVVGIALKSDANGGDYGKAVYVPIDGNSCRHNSN